MVGHVTTFISCDQVFPVLIQHFNRMLNVHEFKPISGDVYMKFGFWLSLSCILLAHTSHVVLWRHRSSKGNSCIDGVALIISGVRFPMAKCHCNDIISHLRNSLTGARSVTLIWMPIILDDNPSTQQTSTCDNWEFGSKISLKRTVC